MVRIDVVGLGLFLLALPLVAAESVLPPLQTVDNLDLNRYQGRWYEIARLPNRFQEDCARDVQVRYSLLEDGDVEVVNQCTVENGGVKSVTGMARKQDDSGPASKLEVRFAPAWLSFLPMVWGQYEVIDLADDYSWAVVGHPKRTYFWILSRSPSLEESTIEGILRRAREQGYEFNDLVRSRHSRIPGEASQSLR